MGLDLTPGSKAAIDRLAKFAEGLQTLERRTLLEVSRAYREEILPGAAASRGVALGRPLRGFGKGSKAVLGEKFGQPSGEDTISVDHKHWGPWQIVDGQVKPHAITSKRAVGGTRAARRANAEASIAAGQRLTLRQGRALVSRGAARKWLSVNGSPRAWARHPGKSSKGILEIARRQLEDSFGQIMQRAHQEALRQTFRGR